MRKKTTKKKQARISYLGGWALFTYETQQPPNNNSSNAQKRANKQAEHLSD